MQRKAVVSLLSVQRGFRSGFVLPNNNLCRASPALPLERGYHGIPALRRTMSGTDVCGDGVSRRIPSGGIRPLHGTARSSSLSSSSPTSGEEMEASISGQFGDTVMEGKDIAGAMEALATADAVCFDVDSTVITEEGIDVLADSLGKGPAVAAWTLQAMEGDTKFQDALSARLQIMKPSRSDVQTCLQNHPLQFSPGIQTLISTLRSKGIEVYLVSGGFRDMIDPVAEALGLDPSTHVLANSILYDSDGNYAGFDTTEHTSRDMGKPAALRYLMEEHGYEKVVMVGDGATDAQAKPPARAFIGYGGVSVRENVRGAACWYVRGFEGMIAVVEQFALGK